MEDQIIKAVNDVFENFEKEKLVFNIINGGWEKIFEMELGYNLLKQRKENGWVKMQDQRVDLHLYDNNFESEAIVELGHYTLNQQLMSSDSFKPITDIEKRKKNDYENIFHLQLLEYVHTNDPNKGFKYGTQRRATILDYLTLYEESQLYYKLIYMCNLPMILSYNIEVYIFLSHKI